MRIAGVNGGNDYDDSKGPSHAGASAEPCIVLVFTFLLNNLLGLLYNECTPLRQE